MSAVKEIDGSHLSKNAMGSSGWDITSCTPADFKQRFGETYRFSFQEIKSKRGNN
jgi:hypothetical protein